MLAVFEKVLRALQSVCLASPPWRLPAGSLPAHVRVSMSAVSCSMLAVATAIASFASLISLFVFFVSSEHQYLSAVRSGGCRDASISSYHKKRVT